MDAYCRRRVPDPIRRLRIAVAPALLANELGAAPGQRRQIALVGTRTPSGTFEIAEAISPKPTHHVSLSRAETAGPRMITKRRRLWPVAGVTALMLGLALGGYSMLKPSSKSAQHASGKSPLPEAGLAEKSIAVLPFQNLSDDEQFRFLVAGLQNEILSDLSKIAGLKVISRTSMMQYPSGTAHNLREIAKQVGAQYLVEGTVQRAGGQIRVSAQLIDGRTDMHLWGERYDRELTDAFAIENDLAEKIVAQLKGKVSPEEKAAIEQSPARLR